MLQGVSVIQANALGPSCQLCKHAKRSETIVRTGRLCTSLDAARACADCNANDVLRLPAGRQRAIALAGQYGIVGILNHSLSQEDLTAFIRKYRPTRPFAVERVNGEVYDPSRPNVEPEDHPSDDQHFILQCHDPINLSRSRELGLK